MWCYPSLHRYTLANSIRCWCLMLVSFMFIKFNLADLSTQDNTLLCNYYYIWRILIRFTFSLTFVPILMKSIIWCICVSVDFRPFWYHWRRVSNCFTSLMLLLFDRMPVLLFPLVTVCVVSISHESSVLITHRHQSRRESLSEIHVYPWCRYAYRRQKKEIFFSRMPVQRVVLLLLLLLQQQHSFVLAELNQFSETLRTRSMWAL